MRKTSYYIYLGIGVLVSCYFALAGLTMADYHKDMQFISQHRDSLRSIRLDTIHVYKNVELETVYDVQVVNAEAGIDDRFSYFHDLSDRESKLLLAASSGWLAGIVRLLLNAVYYNKNKRKNSDFLIPLLSSLSGIVAYFIVLNIPDFFMLHGNSSDPSLYGFVAFIAGIFTKSVFDKLNTYVGKEKV